MREEELCHRTARFLRSSGCSNIEVACLAGFSDRSTIPQAIRKNRQHNVRLTPTTERRLKVLTAMSLHKQLAGELVISSYAPWVHPAIDEAQRACSENRLSVQPSEFLELYRQDPQPIFTALMAQIVASRSLAIAISLSDHDLDVYDNLDFLDVDKLSTDYLSATTLMNIVGVWVTLPNYLEEADLEQTAFDLGFDVLPLYSLQTIEDVKNSLSRYTTAITGD